MSDKTYSEIKGHSPFDWNKWLDAAIADPNSITKEEHAKVCGLSFKWVTCACGNQCAIIPRYETGVEPEDDPGPGMPEDPVLQSLGGDFHAEITYKGWGEAKRVLQDIEARSAILIQEELAKLNQK